MTDVITIGVVFVVAMLWFAGHAEIKTTTIFHVLRDGDRAFDNDEKESADEDEVQGDR